MPRGKHVKELSLCKEEEEATQASSSSSHCVLRGRKETEYEENREEKQVEKDTQRERG